MPYAVMLVLALAAGTPQTNALSAGRIREEVASVVAQRLRDAGSDARISGIDGVRDQSLPAGRVELSVGEIAGRWPRTRAGVPVRVEVDGRLVRTLTAWVTLRDMRVVLTYADAAAARTPAEALRLLPADVDMTCCDAAAAVAATGDLAGMRLRRSARAGAPVLATDFEPMPEVSARERVDIEVDRGMVRLRTRGVALMDGRIGERIQVRPDAAEEAIVARVVATRKVRIDEDTP